MSEDSQGLSLEKAIREYDEGLVIIKRCAKRRQLESDVAFNAVLKVLMAKDVIAKQKDNQLTSSQVFLHLHQLDARFDASSQYIRQAARTPYAQKILKSIQIHEKLEWWRLLHRSRQKLILRASFRVWDCIFKWLTIILLAISFCILANILPRFWVVGITPEGVIGIIIPSVITLFSGKSIFIQTTNGYSLLDKWLGKIPLLDFKIIKPLVIVLISLVLCWYTVQWNKNLKEFSVCYFNRSLRGIPGISGTNYDKKNYESQVLCRVTFILSGTYPALVDKQTHIILPGKSGTVENVLGFFEKWISKIFYNDVYSESPTQSENDLKRAVAINPDYHEAHFYLGWLYELRQDLKNAETEYNIAIQNESLLARVRVARIYMMDGDKKTTSKSKLILIQGLNKARAAKGEDDEIKILKRKIKSIKKKYNNLTEFEKDKEYIELLQKIFQYVERVRDRRIYYTRLAEVSLIQKTWNDSKRYLQQAFQEHWRIIDTASYIPENMRDRNNTAIACIYGEYLGETKQKPYKSWLDGPMQDVIDGNPRGFKTMTDVWRKCDGDADISDPDDEIWKTKYEKKFQN
jgi:hypothetical protein